MVSEFITLSGFISELEREVIFRKRDGFSSPKLKNLIPYLEDMLGVDGDFEFDLNKMKAHFGV